MDHNKKKLEAVLEYLMNGEQEEASKLLHDVVVEQARRIYENIMDEDDYEEMTEEYGMSEDEDMSDSFGGDAKEDFIDDVDSDMDADMGDDAASEEPEMDIEDRVGEIEDSLEQLRAEFERLLSDEEVEHGEDYDLDGELGDEDKMAEGDYMEGDYMEGDYMEDDMDMMEATNFADKVTISMKEEGKEVGAGSKATVNTDNTFARQARKDFGGKPHEIGPGGPEKGRGKVSAKDAAAEDNVDVPTQKEKAPHIKPKSEGNARSVLPESKKRK